MTTIDRLAAARPDTADPKHVASEENRERLLLSIVAKPAIPRWRVAGAVGATAAAAAAAALVGGLPIDPTSSVRDTDATRVTQQAPLLLDRVRLAVADGAKGLLRIETDYGNGVRWETWLDEPSQQWRSTSRTLDGQALYEHQVNGSPDGTSVLVVSHKDRAWWTYAAPEWREPAKLYLTPQEIRAQLEKGELREVSRQPGESGKELRLRGEASQKAPGVYTAALDLWVDADTYLPTRLAATLRNGHATTATYTWLPRTEADLRNTRVEIPPGYHRMPAAPAEPGHGEHG